jgi:hypothetical protein
MQTRENTPAYLRLDGASGMVNDIPGFGECNGTALGTIDGHEAVILKNYYQQPTKYLVGTTPEED